MNNKNLMSSFNKIYMFQVSYCVMLMLKINSTPCATARDSRTFSLLGKVKHWLESCLDPTQQHRVGLKHG